MSVRVIGTGSSDGVPNPFCDCDTCDAERRVGRQRTNTCALIDEVVMCDWGPTAATQALRFGVDIRRIAHVLITHGHPDHFAPQFLMWRGWIADLDVLHVWGPADVIDAAAHWVGPDDPVQLHTVRAGDSWTLAATAHGGPWHVQAVAAAHDIGNGDIHAENALLYVISGEQRVMYATDTGPLPEHTIEHLPPLDVLLMEETFGTHTQHGTGHQDLDSFAATVHLMRKHQVVHDGTRVVAVHLSHHNPPTPELAERLAAIGAEVVDDGTVVGGAPRHHLVLGGTRSGKSRYAESLLRDAPAVTYLATGYPPSDADPEWAERIARHRAHRPAHWQVEETLNVAQRIRSAPAPVLVDCMNLWLTRVIDDADAWSDPQRARLVSDAAVAEVLDALDAAEVPVVLVTNDVGTSLIPENDAARLFQSLLGEVNARLGAHCDDVTMVVAGQPMTVKRD